MAMQPVTRKPVPEQVFTQILTDIVGEELHPGEALPSERRLAEVFAVSRPAVREALKHLSAAGLIEVRQGGLTTVRDFRRHASLDLLPQLLLRDGELDTAVARSLFEARLCNGVQVATLAARRGGPQLAPLLGETLQDMAVERAPVARQLVTLTFWDHVVDAAGSIVFRLMFNAFRAAYEPTLPIFAEHGALGGDDTVDKHTAAYRGLADAILRNDPPAAGDAAHALLAATNAVFINVLNSLAERR